MRHLSRCLAVQTLYSLLLNTEQELNLINDFCNDDEIKIVLNKVDNLYYHELLSQSWQSFETLLTQYYPYCSRAISEISPVEKSILVIAALELNTHLEIPVAIIINEAILLAKKFGGSDSYRFINGLVDKLAKNSVRAPI